MNNARNRDVYARNKWTGYLLIGPKVAERHNKRSYEAFSVVEWFK
jgi:hypothetical protein